MAMIMTSNERKSEIQSVCVRHVINDFHAGKANTYAGEHKYVHSVIFHPGSNVNVLLSSNFLCKSHPIHNIR